MSSARLHHRFTKEAAQDLRAQGFVIFTLALRPDLHRDEARRLTRAALQDALQRHFGCDSHDVSIETAPGQAPVVTVQGRTVHVSFSYESGGAFIAIDMCGPIGIDAASARLEPEWCEECLGVAKDYLPPPVTAEMAGLAGVARATAFSRAWALQEARLKCSGLPLQEWSTYLEAHLAATQAHELGSTGGCMVAYARYGGATALTTV